MYKKEVVYIKMCSIEYLQENGITLSLKVLYNIQMDSKLEVLIIPSKIPFKENVDRFYQMVKKINVSLQITIITIQKVNGYYIIITLRKNFKYLMESLVSDRISPSSMG